MELWKNMRTLWRRHLSILMIIAVGMIAVASTLVAMSIRPPDTNRNPASANKEKLDILLPASSGARFENGPVGSMKKTGSFLDIEIVRGDSTENNGVSTFSLLANVASSLDVENLKFEWLLPPDVTLTSGQVSGDLGNLARGAQRQLELTLSGPAIENHQVHLHVFRLINGEPNGQVAQFNSIAMPLPAQAEQTKLEILNAGFVSSKRRLKIHQ